jgi:hypothetical protein
LFRNRPMEATETFKRDAPARPLKPSVIWF